MQLANDPVKSPCPIMATAWEEDWSNAWQADAKRFLLPNEPQQRPHLLTEPPYLLWINPLFG